jgi:16S rRNA processing protein RimM
MLRLEDLVSIGYIKKAHGYKGQVRIQITLPEAEEIETEHVFLKIDGKPVPFFIVDISGPMDQWIVQLDGVKNEDAAKKLTGAQVYLEMNLFAGKDLHIPTSVLIGMQVHDMNLGKLGLISNIIEKTGQDLLEMEFKGTSFLIPFVPELIMKVDKAKKNLLVNLPEGLLEIGD